MSIRAYVCTKEEISMELRDGTGRDGRSELQQGLKNGKQLTPDRQSA